MRDEPRPPRPAPPSGEPARPPQPSRNGPTVMTSEAIATVEAYFEALGTRDMERIHTAYRTKYGR
ncbi:hypothetical protein GCM10010313_01630 [Streptomyces violarus]|nr:hypothetical protein GCM10010313_01630 [Streptomyces violarus]